jgi:hypothetical protein
MEKHDASGALLRDLRKKGHYTVDNEFLDSGFGAIVKPAGIAVYNVLCRHANINTSKAFPSVPTIARKAGISERQVFRTLATLQELNIISYIPKRGRGHQNEYCLLDVSEWAEIKHDTQSPFTKHDTQSGFSDVKHDTQSVINPLKHDTQSGEQTNLSKVTKRTTTNSEKTSVVVVGISDIDLKQLLHKYSILEPLAKLKKIIIEEEISDVQEIENALHVASQKATNKNAILSYARTLFFEGCCVETPQPEESEVSAYDSEVLSKIQEAIG